VQQGPRHLQSVLQRLAAQIDEQRLLVLLAEQRDAPVDVQVGDQLFEDAPQELRARLWMALLERPELVDRYRALLAAAEAARDEGGGGGGGGADREEGGGGGGGTGRSSPAAAEGAATAAAAEPDWEVVPGGVRRQGRHLLAGASQSGASRAAPRSPAREAYRNDLMAAMAAVPWPLPAGYPPDCRYATLLQISVGQEEVDEVITRDIHRTFPEHPQFAFEQGQQALFRVLKAYSLHDLEVNYCQGMAFLAGLLLFFVGEEPAFQILCRLLRAGGPDLRRLYLPGLAGLKVELRRFEALLERHMPALRAHLEAHGAVPVLYASQWFLTAFSCPFPVPFACRLVDAMLASDSDDVLPRAALAVMAECEAELMARDDFEELLTYLKVAPLQWAPHRLRRVLNAALGSPVGAAELGAARTAAEADDRHPLMAAPGGGGRGGGRLAGSLEGIEGVGGVDGAVLGQLSAKTTPRSSSQGHEGDASARVSAARPAAGPTPPRFAAPAAAAAAAGDDLDAELAKQRDELDTAYVQMVLALDQTWGGEEDEGAAGGASQAYAQALDPNPPAAAPPPPPSE
jgi:hypothetical protein